MKLKTFQAPTMADALAQVRKSLGPDAMILHTRSYRVGSWLGMGGKNMVEITASAGEPDRRARAPKRPAARSQEAAAASEDRSAVLGGAMPNARSRRRAAEPAEVVVQRAASVTDPVAAMKSDSTRDGTPPRHAARTERLVRPTPPSDRSTLNPEPDSPRLHLNDPGRMPRRAAPPQAIEPKPPASAAQTPSPAATENPEELRAQIADLQKMMGQVLDSTRRTAVAVGKVDPAASLGEGTAAGPLLTMTQKMVDNDTPMEVVEQIIGRVRDRLDPIELRDETVVRQAVLREIEATILTRSDSLLSVSAGAATGRPRIIALVGPTGVGKTTTVAKVAATAKLRHGKRVGLITSDTYRIAAVEQLRTYAGIIGLPIKVVMSPDEMTAAIAEMFSMDVIIVDTAGRSQHDSKRIDELKAFMDAASPDETHLVLSSTVGDLVSRRTAERFMPLGPDRCILTKLDEAVCSGQIAGLTQRIGLPLSFVTVGQEVPDDIEPARADRLARTVLDGPGVLFEGSDGRDR